ncbi:hypothetical protein [Flavobacterium hercynium]|uniref:hypothetical protein n=1 Tax=Flavobacterium hercynium TaxID=387094 RepID=UPI001FCAEEE6|nr:hypothetical protein [Flavobacterium hercynium]SMP03683.1 hypothetical protein SAMN06265346_101317 [Flavobacterium hercynium]
MKKIILLIFLCCISTYGKPVSDSIANHLSLLNNKQKTILYEFEVLKNNGFSTDQFWLKHKSQFSGLTNDLRDELAKQVFENSHIEYAPPKDSAVKLWMQTQFLTNWMFYLSAFIAICALVALFRNYWNMLLDVLVKRLAPLFRLLFSPVLLTYELLLVGVACVFYGCTIEEFVLRTVIIHFGLCLLWSQSTAIFVKEYWVKKYFLEIENKFWGVNPWDAIKTICLPAIIITGALLYVLYKVPADTFYNYEIVLSSLTAVYALPFWRVVEKYLHRILFPFQSDQKDRSIKSLGGCTIIALLAVIGLVLQWNPVFYNVIAALISLLLFSFLILSSKFNYRYNFANYYYLQFITILFLGAVFMYGFHIRLSEIVWFSLIAGSIYIMIKYFEIFSFFSDWKRSKAWAWKLLGFAVLLWLLAKAILYVSQNLYGI